MRRTRVVTLLVAVLLTLGVGYQATPSSACLVPCNVSPKAMGVILGGGIPGDYTGFTIGGSFRGVYNGKSVNISFSVGVGGDSPSYNYIWLGDEALFANVTMQTVGGLAGQKPMGLITISRSPYSTRNVTGHIQGFLGGNASRGHLEVYDG